MTQLILPLPETAFSSWQSLVREFGRAQSTMLVYNDEPRTHWEPYGQTLKHMRRILHPNQIDQLSLTRECHRQARDNPGGDLTTEWSNIAEAYADLGFAHEADAARNKAKVLQVIDWSQVSLDGDRSGTNVLPEELQKQLDQLFTNDQRLAKSDALGDIRDQFASQSERYTILPDETFNELLVDVICTSPRLQAEINKIATEERNAEKVIPTRPEKRKELAAAVVEAGVYLRREIWDYLPTDASDTTQRSLWLTDVGILSVVETPHGTDDDPEPYCVDVNVAHWPAGALVASLSYDHTTKTSREAKLAEGRKRVDRFSEAAEQLFAMGKSGPWPWMHTAFMLGFILHVVFLATHPRMNFRFFRGMGQLGVKSAMILQHLAHAVLWVAIIWFVYARGAVPIILRSLLAGNASWSDIAFFPAVIFGFFLLCQTIPTALGLLIGSFERRFGLGWVSNLPKTCHENFITRRASKK